MHHPIRQFFTASDRVDLDGLRVHLDGLTHRARVDAIRQLGRGEQARLFDAAKGFKPITLESFVPKNVGDMVEVIHHGRNTLLAFNFFQKRFCRPAGRTDELWGYNEQSMRWAVGPGYFVTRQSGADEVVIDYYSVPPGKVASWPEIRSNAAGLSRLVYNRMQDFMRGVSEHVTIGRAAKNGRNINAWFVLCRDDGAAGGTSRR